MSRIASFYILPTLTLALLSSVAVAQVHNVKNEATQLKKVLQQYHLEPRSINDEFSRRVYQLLMQEIDPDGMYFTVGEIDKLSFYKDKIDDEISGTAWNFFPLLLTTYKQALLRSEANIVTATSSAVDIHLRIDISDTTRARDDSAHSKLWNTVAKAEILVGLAELRPTYAKLSDREFMDKHEPVLRQRVRLKEQRTIKRILNHTDGYDKYMATLFLDCISHAFDAHSAYFSPTQMENFMSVLSSEGFYFGISLDENENGEFVITNLRPGGPAWKSGAVHNGDVIEKLRWAGGEWIEVVGMEEDEIDQILSESNHNILELTLRNITSGSQVVQLKKEKLNSEDNLVRSFVLTGEKKIGYISLPDFYSEWGDQEGAQCANDVAREILKLKRENIEGLILDVRFNGGGSLAEAVAMAGTFVDAGPMGILKTKATDPLTMKDMNRGTVYDGPLVVMVNRLSASAAEFVAAALQDYRRAIIVGTQTYGKATGQEMYPLTPGKTEIDYTKLNATPWGFATITTSRIYRINGKSVQRNGVEADIRLPDFYDIGEYSEAALPFALLPDSSSKKTYYSPFRAFPLSQLRAKSAARVKADTLFTSIQKYVKDMQKDSDATMLEWTELTRDAFAGQAEFAALTSALARITPVFSIAVPGQEQQRLLWNEYDESVHAALIKNISKDISLEEAFHILCDYITLNP